MTLLIILICILILCIVLFFFLFVPWGTRWGATEGECAMQMTGDSYLDGGPAHRTSMTRAVSINKPPRKFASGSNSSAAQNDAITRNGNQ